MRQQVYDPSDHSFAHAVEVQGASRLLFISGQIPEDEQGQVPADFKPQARLVWHNIEKRLVAAGMTFENLVKITVFLSSREYRTANFEVRHEVLKGRNVAVTIIICDIYDEAWLLEIEAIAAA